ncbi:MAG: hypothetical protein KKB81_05745 [Candidatus Margulisbacteria bacterium]|nr:hypothetical protein [Candidatus Margulisiibacteriota bacterium]MBU1021851.1 hypothetical protein [Candidatus Margulisiibacteriota bacterium]MBU1729010.1 hypothetical protein [Candidatus Margulisiibacteriota bacterium]MBU1954437.1 hypothetical protein [Candidatus Margulisiibacteriota bacterium]
MNRILAIIILIILAFFIMQGLFTGKEHLIYGQPTPKISKLHVESGVAETGALNLVTAIYLNYRAYDTLGEAVVFFVAALGVFMLLRKDYREGTD